MANGFQLFIILEKVPSLVTVDWSHAIATQSWRWAEQT